MATKLRENMNQYEEITSLATSAKRVIGDIDVNNARTVTITIKGTTNASATSGLRLNVYYSPTGNRDDWDTVPFAFFDLDLSAGNKTQETHNFIVPELGEIKMEIQNLDAAQVATLIQVWASIKRHQYKDIVEEIRVLDNSINKNLLVLIGSLAKK